ncbi:hypothetical protein [uncultured Parabacteroides sp.]|uniref:hypothetical protein n=1 Tax=uncultured Parabacteroides sp. TaxID=512312 RepID=UPI002805B3A2|nr:hypothetical protein [uncultured Parabacteroides sp.]
MKYFKLSKYITQVFRTPDEIGCWFGYYNYDPLNYNQTKMLGHRTKNDACLITKDMIVEVGYYDIPNGEWHMFGKSDSFNWPQGTMLQWIPGVGNENKAIYNLSKEGNHIARIHDIVTGEDRDISWAIYSLTPDGKKSITIDMERAHWTRGYHYESVVKKELDVPVLKNDGIFEINLEQNTRKLLIPIESIIQLKYEPCFENAKHWIEHIMISPKGKRFCFLHRFSSIDNVLKYTTRLIISDIDGRNLQVIDGDEKYNWSHFGWDGDDAFSIYTYEQKRNINVIEQSVSPIKESGIRGVLRKLISDIVPPSIKKEIRIIKDGQKQYYQYYIFQKEKFSLFEIYKKRVFDIDGHQSYTADGIYMITDTYPDCNQYQRLIVYNKQKHKALILAYIYAALHKKPGSCDLHPKLCKNNNYLVVDTAYDGKHHMILFRLNWNLINKYFS